jgi:hypothetical protein
VAGDVYDITNIISILCTTKLIDDVEQKEEVMILNAHEQKRLM